MTQATDKADLMARLERVLAAYGADAARWPNADRAILVPFLDADPVARQRLDAEAMFDDVLAAAPGAAPHVAAARAQDALFARLDAEPSSPAETAPQGSVVPFHKAARPRPASTRTRNIWREAAVLAAALLIGVFTGAQGLLDAAGLDLGTITSAAGTTTAAADADDASELALGTAADDLTEEDLL